MAKFIKYRAYYGTFFEYYSTPSKAILFFTSVTNNVKDVEVLNEPILDWDVSKAGNVTFKLPTCNVGYSAIKCKIGHIFIEQNGELIWHGRAITETFDDERNREIVCEGALNYLLDTHVKPLNIPYLASYGGLFDNLIDCHNRSLSAASSVILPVIEWTKTETNGTISASSVEIMFTATGTTNWGLAIWSSPSIWKYRENAGKKVRISFKATKYGTGGSYLTYGIHLRNDAIAGHSSRLVWVDGDEVYNTSDVNFTTYLGPGGLNGSGHEDAYIGFHMYFNAVAGDRIRITDLRVEFYFDYHDDSDKVFPINEGSRRGITRIPNRDTGSSKVIDIRDYPSTLDAINNIFISNYGGYLYVSYEPDGNNLLSKHPVLNYISGVFETDIIGQSQKLPEIRAGKNLISFKETTDWTSYPTVIIPLGKQKEEWEKVVPAVNITYTTKRYLDKDGYLLENSDAKYCVATLPVVEGEIYFVYGEGKNELGMYSIVNSSGDILDHKVFSNRDGDWYSHEEIEIPNGATSLRVFFYNSNSASLPPARSLFIIDKYNFEDLEDYITLESYIPMMDDGVTPARTDDLNGTKYVPLIDMSHIYTYGWIEQVVHFDDAKTKSELYSMAARYCTMFENAVVTYEAEAAEIAPLLGDQDYIPIGMPGSYSNLVVPNMSINKVLCVTKCSINLRNFAKNTYSLANLPPPDLADLLAKGLYL